MNSRSILKTLLILGFLYFFDVSVTHFLGWKVPGFFIYFDIPSNAYQDRIISVLAMGWALFYLQAGLNPRGNRSTIGTIIAGGTVALIGLSINTLNSNLNSLNPSASIKVIWIQIAVLFVYLILLSITFYGARNKLNERKYENS